MPSLTRRALGSIWIKPQNRRKKSSKTAKKVRAKPKTVCKTVKTDNFSHLSYQNPNQSDTVRDQWRRIIAHGGETGTHMRKNENYIGYQIQKPTDVFYENRKPNLEKRKIRN